MAQEVPRWSQRGSKSSPRTAKIAQEGPKMAHVPTPKRRQNGAKGTQGGPRWTNFGPKMDPRGFKRAKLNPNMEYSTFLKTLNLPCLFQ